jgi:hypothetical protein
VDAELRIQDRTVSATTTAVLRNVEVEEGLRLVTKDDCGGHANHERLDTFSWTYVYPDALSPHFRIEVLDKTTHDTTHYKRAAFQRLVAGSVIDRQYFRVATELDALHRSRN